MRKRALVFMLVLAVIFCSCTQDRMNEKENEDSIGGTEGFMDSTQTDTDDDVSTGITFYDEEINGMKSYLVKTCDSKEDINWSEIPAAKIDEYRWVEGYEPEAYAQLVYVRGEGFICKMTCIESSPKATYKEQNDPVCLDSCLEFFAIFDGGDKYVNIEANSIGTQYLAIGKNRESRMDNIHRRMKDFPITTAAEVGDTSWSLMITVPLRALEYLYPGVSDDTYKSGFTFRGNFFKTGSAEITGAEHYGMWNPSMTENPDFHQPDYFGILVME